MKTIALALITLSTLTAPALAADAPSTHGMLVFGKAQTYFSHLPMFHNPHNYQMIALGELSAQASAAYKGAQIQFPDSIFTLVPERFSLPQMVAKPSPFQSDLFQGHFERSGVEIAHQEHTKLGKVLIFEKLDAGNPALPQAKYYLIGQQGEFFLVHKINAKPSFDQVLAVNIPADLKQELTTQDFLLLEAPGQSDFSPLEEGATVSFQAANKKGPSYSVQIVNEIYLELGDLAD